MNRRTATIITPGLLRVEQRLQLTTREIGTDVAGPACVYAQVRVRRGAVAYRLGPELVRAPRLYAVFLPPFAIVQAAIDHSDVTSRAWIFQTTATRALPHQALFWRSDNDTEPVSIDDILRRVFAAEDATSVDRAPDPGSLAEQAKAIIDGSYRTVVAIGAIAPRLGVSPARLSRTFKQTYGIAPVRYRHQIRVVDALTRFADGAVPSAVFQDVGFNDLSRFYKIFGRLACAPPGTYRPSRSAGARNAKT
jgi:AraC-like DNA-binding protein